MKKILLFLSVWGLLSFAPDKLVKTKVADGIVISLPPELSPMTPEDIVQRYPSVRAPLAAYTDLNRTLDFSVNVSATQWPDANLEMAQKFFKSSIHSFYDRIDMIEEGVHEVHKKKLIFLEFESRVNGNKMVLGEQSPVYRYTYIQYLVEPGRTLVFSFNCPKSSKEDWQETVRAMMKTIRIK
ncbi:MAG: hypothetical protein KIT62_08310 [Cyclobacteriaceae bacterium]|nr:hypothetical protein [Cyclobacteriaceae bacterium]